MPEHSVRKAAADGRTHISSASRMIKELPTIRLASGHCIDLSPVQQVVQNAAAGSQVSEEAAAASIQAWDNTMALLGSSEQIDPNELAGFWTITGNYSGWTSYISPKWETQYRQEVQQKMKNNIIIQIEKAGNEYIGKVVKAGNVFPAFDHFGGRDRVFYPGLDVLKVKKVAKNLYRGKKLHTAWQSGPELTQFFVQIGVFGEAARLTRMVDVRFGSEKDIDWEKQHWLKKNEGHGDLLLRISNKDLSNYLSPQINSKTGTRHRQSSDSMILLDQTTPGIQ
jgi:hypothetical protein